MKSKLRLSFTAALLSAALVASFNCHDPELEARSQSLAGEPAPAFNLTDTNGNSHSLADYSGKWVVLEWVNYDCPYVEKHYESNNMQSLQAKYTAEGVVWLSINSSAPGKQGNFPPARVNELIAEQNASPSAYLLDPEGTVGRNYGAKATPHMYVISPEGKIVYQGAIDSIDTSDADDIPDATNYVVEALTQGRAGEEIAVASTSAYGCSVKYD